MFRARVVAMVVVAAGLVGCPTATDVCEDVDCGAGRCVVDRGAAACWCDDGFVADGLTCVPAAVDPCAANPCAGESASVCVADGGAASCVCPADRIDVDGGCVLRSACVPSPCGAVAHQSICELVDGGAQCRCEPGYAPADGGCADTPAWTCDGPVHGAAGSWGEPDDCPPQATALTEGAAPLPRELRPAGDEDWYALPVQPGHVYEFGVHVSGGVTSALLEVFDAQGFTLLSADTSGTANARVRFRGTAASPVLARVWPMNPAGTCSYEVHFAELGLDDWPDVAGATVLMPGARFEGEVQFPGDLDVVKLAVPAYTAVRLSMLAPDGGAAPDLAIDVWSADGGASRRLQCEDTVVAFPHDEDVVLVAQGRTSQATGRFALDTQSLGPDDFSDERAFAQLVTATGAPVSARFERSGDLDSIAFAPDAGNYYQLSCDLPGDAGCGVTVRVGTHVVTSGAAPLWRNGFAQPLQATFSSTELGDYSFTLRDFGPDDHTFLPGTLVTVGTPVAGRLEETADVDAFRFAAQARHVYRLALTSASPDLLMSLYDTRAILLSRTAVAYQYFLETAGEYRVVVRTAAGTEARMLDYELTIVDEGPDDHGDTAATATPLVLGQPMMGASQYYGDVDWLSFDAVQDHLYRVDCATASGWCRFTVYEPSGQAAYLGLPTAGGVVHAPQTGTMTVRLPDGASSSWMEPYTLTVTDLGPEDHGDTDATATPYTTFGASVPGVLGYAADLDVFRFDGVAGQTYAITCVGCRVSAHMGSASLLPWTPTVFDATPQGILVPTTGPVFVTVHGYSSLSSTYALSIEQTGPDDYGDTEAAATPAALDTPVSGVAQFDADTDVLVFPVTPSRIYRVACTSSFMCDLTALSGGVSIGGWDSSSVAELVVKPSTAQLVLRLRSPTGVSAWTVSVSDVGVDDHGDTAATATPLTLSAPATAGSLQFSADVDAFSVGPVQAGDIVRFSLSGGTAARRSLRLQSAGVPVDGVLDGVATLQLGIRADAPGTVVGLVSGGWPWPDPFTLSAELVTDDDGDSPSTATPLTLGVPATGREDYPGDLDYFSVNLAAGLWLLNVSGVSSAYVYAPNASVVATTTASVIFSAAVPGTYVVRVRGSAPQVPYTITVQ